MQGRKMTDEEKVGVENAGLKMTNKIAGVEKWTGK